MKISKNSHSETAAGQMSGHMAYAMLIHYILEHKHYLMSTPANSYADGISPKKTETNYVEVSGSTL